MALDRAGSAAADAAPFLRLDRVSRAFGTVRAVDDVSLDVRRGELFALLGGSGCGKTTLLRIVAGLERPDAGRLLIDGVDVTEVPPYERPVNTVFQSYALFPHMSVAQNVAFGLEQERRPRAEVRERVARMLELVHLADLAGRRPDQLSGGQRQRVALARALAKQPKILLLDEPLAALDRKLREHTRLELVNIQRRVGTTFVLVTHDQEEALAMAQRIAVMDAGRVVQVADPATLYEHPATRMVAEFIGAANVFDGRVVAQAGDHVRIACDALAAHVLVRHGHALAPGTRVALALRPEKIDVRRDAAPGADNALVGRVEGTAYLGDVSVYHVRTESGALLRTQETHESRSLHPHYAVGDTLHLAFDAGAAVVLTQ